MTDAPSAPGHETLKETFDKVCLEEYGCTWDEKCARDYAAIAFARFPTPWSRFKDWFASRFS